MKFQLSLLGQQLVRFIVMVDDNVAVSITFAFYPDQFQNGILLADYSFDTFTAN